MLKRFLDTLDGLEENMQELYVEKDGKFHLNVEPDDKGEPPDKSGKWIPKQRFDQVIEQKKSAEGALKVVADELCAQVPEEMRELIPDLPPEKKIKWLQGALSKGVFSDIKTEGPDGKRPGGKQPTDFDNMSPAQMRKAGYKTK